MRHKTLLLVGVIGLAGCYYPQTFHFVQLNPQNPLRAAQRIHVASPVFNAATVAGLKGSLRPEQQASLDQDLDGLATFFGNYVQDCKRNGALGSVELVGVPGRDVYVATVSIESLQLGSYGGSPTAADYLVEIHAPDGALVESYRATSLIAYGFSSGERVRSMGAQIALNVCRYLRARRLGNSVDQS